MSLAPAAQTPAQTPTPTALFWVNIPGVGVGMQVSRFDAKI